MKILGNLVLLLAVAFLAFTQLGQEIAADLFMRAHEYVTSYLTQIFQDSLR